MRREKWIFNNRKVILNLRYLYRGDQMSCEQFGVRGLLKAHTKEMPH